MHYANGRLAAGRFFNLFGFLRFFFQLLAEEATELKRRGPAAKSTSSRGRGRPRWGGFAWRVYRDSGSARTVVGARRLRHQANPARASGGLVVGRWRSSASAFSKEHGVAGVAGPTWEPAAAGLVRDGREAVGPGRDRRRVHEETYGPYMPAPKGEKFLPGVAPGVRDLGICEAKLC